MLPVGEIAQQHLQHFLALDLACVDVALQVDTRSLPVAARPRGVVPSTLLPTTTSGMVRCSNGLAHAVEPDQRRGPIDRAQEGHDVLVLRGFLILRALGRGGQVQLRLREPARLDSRASGASGHDQGEGAGVGREYIRANIRASG